MHNYLSGYQENSYIDSYRLLPQEMAFREHFFQTGHVLYATFPGLIPGQSVRRQARLRIRQHPDE